MYRHARGDAALVENNVRKMVATVHADLDRLGITHLRTIKNVYGVTSTMDIAYESQGKVHGWLVTYSVHALASHSFTWNVCYPYDTTCNTGVHTDWRSRVVTAIKHGRLLGRVYAPAHPAHILILTAIANTLQRDVEEFPDGSGA